MWREQCDKQREEIHENTSLFTVLATFGVSVVWRCPTSTSDYLRSVHHPSPGQNRQYKPFRLVSVPLSCGQKQSISVTDGAPMFRGRCKYNYFTSSLLWFMFLTWLLKSLIDNLWWTEDVCVFVPTGFSSLMWAWLISEKLIRFSVHSVWSSSVKTSVKNIRNHQKFQSNHLK